MTCIHTILDPRRMIRDLEIFLSLRLAAQKPANVLTGWPRRPDAGVTRATAPYAARDPRQNRPNN